MDLPRGPASASRCVSAVVITAVITGTLPVAARAETAGRHRRRELRHLPLPLAGVPAARFDPDRARRADALRAAVCGHRRAGDRALPTRRTADPGAASGVARRGDDPCRWRRVAAVILAALVAGAAGPRSRRPNRCSSCGRAVGRAVRAAGDAHCRGGRADRGRRRRRRTIRRRRHGCWWSELTRRGRRVCDDSTASTSSTASGRRVPMPICRRRLRMRLPDQVVSAPRAARAGTVVVIAAGTGGVMSTGIRTPLAIIGAALNERQRAAGGLDGRLDDARTAVGESVVVSYRRRQGSPFYPRPRTRRRSMRPWLGDGRRGPRGARRPRRRTPRSDPIGDLEPTTRPPPGPTPLRLLVVGDSTSLTIAKALNDGGDGRFQLLWAGANGCALVPMTAIRSERDGPAGTRLRVARTRSCRPWSTSFRPDVVLVMIGPLELVEQRYPGADAGHVAGDPVFMEPAIGQWNRSCSSVGTVDSARRRGLPAVRSVSSPPRR